MPGMIEPIEVEGLQRLSRSLRALGDDAPKALRIAGNSAAKIVVDAAKPRVPLGPAKGGHARNSIKAASTRTQARVSAGGKKFSYYPWLDFGGSVGPGKASKRPFLKEGRYIWKAFADHRLDVEDELRTQLEDIASRAGLEIT